MTYKQIEASREARLWIGQIVVPAITIGMTVLAIPGAKEAVAAKAKQIKTSINTKLKRKNGES